MVARKAKRKTRIKGPGTCIAPAEWCPGDQRSNNRYPISLEVQYKLLNKGRVERLGFGRTLNISKGGVLFETVDILPAKSAIELEISWPVLLEGVCNLRLIMRGRIVRGDAKATAVKTDSYAFRMADIHFPRDHAATSRPAEAAVDRFYRRPAELEAKIN